MSLLRNPFTRYVQRRMRDTVHGRGWGGFHADAVYRGLMVDLLETFGFTSFVETGTYRGYSTEFIALNKPALPIFTTEVVAETYRTARMALRRYPNVVQLLESSDLSIARLIAEGKLGEMPLFYLDAHWQSYWPLRAELTHIGSAGLRTVCVIDDFEVPGNPAFGFDIDGGYNQGAGAHCDLAYIHPSLDHACAYHAAFPKYSYEDGYGPHPTRLQLKESLRGHLVLFQNMAKEYEQFLQRPFVRKHYFDQGELAPDTLGSASEERQKQMEQPKR